MVIAEREKLISLVEAARLLPVRPHASTLSRWASVGVNGLRLATTKVGGRRYTTQSDLERFLRECEEASN